MRAKPTKLLEENGILCRLKFGSGLLDRTKKAWATKWKIKNSYNWTCGDMV